MTRAALALIGSMAVSGCASEAPRYAKANVTDAQKMQDESECAKAAVNSPNGPRTGPPVGVDTITADRCMAERGYTVRPRS